MSVVADTDADAELSFPPSEYMESLQYLKDDGDGGFQWNDMSILQLIAIFLFVGFAEIMGGWLVWAAAKGVRNSNGNTNKKH